MKIRESIVLMYFQKVAFVQRSVVRATTLSSWAVLCSLTRLLSSTKASFSLPAVVSLSTEVYRSGIKEETLAVTTSAEQKVIDAIDALGVPYELIAIDPAYADRQPSVSNTAIRLNAQRILSLSLPKRSRSNFAAALCWLPHSST